MTLPEDGVRVRITGDGHPDYDRLPPPLDGMVDHSEPIVEPDRMSDEQLREAEPDIANEIFDQDQQSRKRVAYVDVPRLIVAQYDYVAGKWVARYHSTERHQVWNANLSRWTWSDTAEGQHDCQPGTVVRGPYMFAQTGLAPSDFREVERRSSKPIRNGAGMVVRRERDEMVFNSMIVWLATPAHHRTKPGGWDDPKMLNRYGAGNGAEVVQNALLMGELTQALAVVMHLSQFGSQLENMVGNLSSGAVDN